MVRSRAWWVVAAVVALASGATVLAMSGAPGDDGDARGDEANMVITVSRSACGHGWADPKPGSQTLQLRNSGVSAADVDLVDSATGVVYGEVEGIAPGTTRPLRVRLGNGTYAFRCLVEDTEAITGPSVRVTGGQDRSGPAVRPVTANDLLGPVREYRAYVDRGLATLTARTATLRTAVHSAARTGNRAASTAAWLDAHLAYERLGAAYGAFGDIDGAINGTADGLPKGVADPDFTGFHRLEYGLWHGQPMASLAAVADRLDADARTLRADFPRQRIDPFDIGRRAHEIVENALQFELTGHTDYGSGTNLATALANLDGTRAVLTVLRPLLTSRLPSLSEVDSWLARADGALRAARRPDGSWTPVAQLDRTRRERLNGAVSQLAELLAPVAEIAEPRRVS